jgi:hypothetical protein
MKSVKVREITVCEMMQATMQKLFLNSRGLDQSPEIVPVSHGIVPVSQIEVQS